MTRFKTFVFSAAMAGALFTPVLASAEDAAPAGEGVPPMHEKFDPKKAFEEADTDKNGSLNLDEFLSRHKEKFVEIDADKSGSLTPEELKTYGEKKHAIRKERREERRERMQEKSDGGVSAPAPAEDTKAP